MPGGRRTHNYPYGKPTGLVLVEIAAAITGVFWLLLFSWGWMYRILIACAFLCLAGIASKLTKANEKSGLAVRIPRVVAVEYPSGLPTSLKLLRVCFFAVVGLMLFFGLVPLPNKVAQNGIIVCVITLFLIGVSHVMTERHFANSGRAVDDYDDMKT